MSAIHPFNRIAFFRHAFAAKPHLVFFFCALCVLCGEITAQDFKQLHPGVEHAQIEHKLGSDPVKINLLRLDLKKVRLDVHHALDKAIGLETTSSIAKRKGAVAAINAGFFRLDKSSWAGDASSLLKIDGRIFSESNIGRIALTIKNEKNTTVAGIRPLLPVSCGINVAGDDGYSVEGINREMKANEAILYTPDFGQHVSIGPDSIGIAIQGQRIVSVSDKTGTIAIPPKGFVVSAHGTLVDLFRDFAQSRARVSYYCAILSDRDPQFGPPTTMVAQFSESEDVVSGVPQLIKDGKVDITWEQEKANRSFVETRHPRTAVAKLKDGKFLMMTVDGRQPGVSVGMSLQELAEYLFSLGAVDAMNLDGGGSTTMFLDGKVVNTPSDKEGERKIGDVIVVTLRKQK
jgi:hypothetical protein